jgi:hypothetical protein
MSDTNNPQPTTSPFERTVRCPHCGTFPQQTRNGGHHFCNHCGWLGTTSGRLAVGFVNGACRIVDATGRVAANGAGDPLDGGECRSYRDAEKKLEELRRQT